MSKYSLNTDKDLLHAAEMKIGELEQRIMKLEKEVDHREQIIANYIVMCKALDAHYNIGGFEGAKVIFDEYIAKEEEAMKAQYEEAKSNLMEGLKKGTVQIIDRREDNV